VQALVVGLSAAAVCAVVPAAASVADAFVPFAAVNDGALATARPPPSAGVSAGRNECRGERMPRRDVELEDLFRNRRRSVTLSSRFCVFPPSGV
jgi:hypothetical protein